jgi:hypothetical protein
MTSLYYPPKFDSGLAGAKLTFSATGTSTLQNTYTDAALTVASSNPVVADANGVFAPIYLDPTLPNYRVKYTTSADVLIYQADDVPSNQGIQQSIRLQSTNPYLFLYDTDGSTNLRKYRIRAAGAAFEVQACDDAEAVFTTILQFTGNVLYSNGTEVAVTSSGSFTGTLTGVSGTITALISYVIVNNIVTLRLNGADFVGTSTSSAMTITGLPVAVRPSIAKAIVCSAMEDNTVTGLMGNATVSGSTIIFGIARTDSTANHVVFAQSGFTSSNVKGITSAWTITYPLA